MEYSGRPARSGVKFAAPLRKAFASRLKGAIVLSGVTGTVLGLVSATADPTCRKIQFLKAKQPHPPALILINHNALPNLRSGIGEAVVDVRPLRVSTRFGGRQPAMMLIMAA